MELLKIPPMSEEEYNRVIEEGHICRVVFTGEKYPYIAPLLYVYDGKHLYMLSTKYGEKIKYFHKNPHVAVEIEQVSRDLSDFRFVILFGRLREVEGEEERRTIRKKFIQLIQEKSLSRNIMTALGHSPEDALTALEKEERSIVWQLTDMEGIKGLKSH
ncbi:MAG: pyridoxamine 5'-phosphate oxidase family protein [Deltaproteobacteria bacterium]|nr:pyridoxamine 5'-phosphate oxidase family protein [Deltaproteobacteria bacterium]